MSKLRPYQATAVAAIEQAWADGKKRPLLVAGTGAGKTEMAAALLSKARSPAAIVHTSVLFEQTARRIPSARVYTVQALIAKGDAGDRRRANLARHDVFFCDEAHHLGAGEWSQVVPFLAHARVFGCTATPMRSDGSPLGDVFDHMVVAANYPELVRDGYLVKCDVSRSDIRRAAQKKNKVRPDGVAAYLEQGRRPDGTWRPNIHFEVTIEACQAAAQRYNEAGVRAAVIDCNTNATERGKLFAQYDAGLLDSLCSPTALAEGFNSCRAECCVLRRSVDHVGDFLQRVGRVLRPFPGKERALLIDICNATEKHGMPTDARAYSLDGKGIRLQAEVDDEEEETEPLPPPSPWQIVESRYALIRDTLLSRYRALQEEATERGYKSGWTWHRFTESTSISPPRMFPAKFRSVCIHCRKRLEIGETMFWLGTSQVFHEECFFNSLDGERLEAASIALESATAWKPSRTRQPAQPSPYATGYQPVREEDPF